MVFICDHCHFLFSSDVQPEQCPDCGKMLVRTATEEEVQDFEQNAGEQERIEMVHMPDFCQTTVMQPGYLMFYLPVSAFGIQDDMIMEISVEYQLSEDRVIYMANVWARVKGSHSMHFLYGPAVPAGENAVKCIVEYLNGDAAFEHLMLDYIYEAAKHR